MAYEVSVTERPAERLTGIWTRTSPATAREDCSALWERLMTSVTAMAGERAYEAFGVSLDFAADGSFMYWAALDAPINLLNEPTWVALGTPHVPLRIEGVATVDLPAGWYASTVAPSLDELAGLYGYLYGAWSKTQAEYGIDYRRPCYECYPADWSEDDPVRLYVPVARIDM